LNKHIEIAINFLVEDWAFSQNSKRLAECVIFLYIVLFDSPVKSQNFDDKKECPSQIGWAFLPDSDPAISEILPLVWLSFR
jgi:hypothetical protein